MNTRWTIFLGIIAAIVFGWFYHLNQLANPQSLILSDKKGELSTPTYIGENMQTLAFNKNGDKDYEATAPKVIYYQEAGLTQFQSPDLILFSDNATNVVPAWQITAKNADLKDDIVTLDKDVRVLNLQPDPVVKTLTTEKAFVNLKNGDYQSPNITTITGPQLSAVGRTMSGNFKQQQITLENQVDTHYEFKQP
ncbi:hypothetical protein A6A19_01250 [Actinobacillus delphinicola]|uniref:Lipopolysaccharide export system protein LptC n=1 Tax=Actinobacillus delphinicola TaxID=51161 RepID=A0A448TVY5_9PAST|nr:LPS export ABC transporter periplasmic protein LptC [Actinobacillus delphinicola]MDG6896654.1 hypothetical protein [Actinobacillus delphinicola]VEJ10087.1 Lipopolysaccharide export system protein lptC [Actinobacillus delphinicola]